MSETPAAADISQDAYAIAIHKYAQIPESIALCMLIVKRNEHQKKL